MIAKKYFLAVFLCFSQSISAAGDDVPRENWIHQFREQFSFLFCNDETLLKNCFKSFKHDCEMSVLEHAKSCANSAGLPKSIKEGEPSAKYGMKIARCIGRKLQSRTVASAKMDLVSLELACAEYMNKANQ